MVLNSPPLSKPVSVGLGYHVSHNESNILWASALEGVNFLPISNQFVNLFFPRHYGRSQTSGGALMQAAVMIPIHLDCQTTIPQ